MNNFQNYAEYYDLFYNDKNYQTEADYIETLLNRFSKNKVKTILDLGCGTGKHDILFAKKGFKVIGVDLSEQMIQIANENKHENTNFIVGDVRNIEFTQTFDAIISLFHVASYQTSNQDFENYLQTAYNHLKKGGLFIFDFWYGPAVLTDLPAVRVKRIENNKIKITRISEPVLQPNKNVVDVHFEVLVENKLNHNNRKIYETHSMRYWFIPEIEFIARKDRFSIVNSFEWMTDNELNIGSWNGIMILKK